jgi:hypothetical protein
MAMKTCNICDETKPLDEFSVLERGSMGRHPACKACRNLQSKEYYAAKRDEILEIKREWRKRTGADRRYSYGLNPEQYGVMVMAQDGRCAICERHPEDGVLRVDHDHSTGKIRGLLCRHCNLALGNMRDDVSLLRKAIAYLEKHQ